MLGSRLIYPFSNPETQVMENYVKEALATSFILVATSLNVASFFFLKKKDGGLWTSA